MPELPEVETVVRDLRPLLIGQRIDHVRCGKRKLRNPWRRVWQSELLGRKVIEIQRRGKWIDIILDGDVHLVFHLGMTGQLTVVTSESRAASHTHLIFRIGSGELRYRDVRRFGSARVLPNGMAVEGFYASSGLGPEPFDLDRLYWQRRLANTRRCLKAVLLDQRVVAGVGNIYADEALFEARLHPMRTASALNRAEANRLRRAIITVLNRAIEHRGSSIRDYLDGNGRQGNFQREFRVYQQTDQPCTRCRTPIEHMRLAGRSTHYCPRCQPLARSKRLSTQHLALSTV